MKTKTFFFIIKYFLKTFNIERFVQCLNNIKFYIHNLKIFRLNYEILNNICMYYLCKNSTNIY